MADDDELQDPVVLAALRRLEAREGRRASLCPRCARRDVVDGSDWCARCAAEVREETKARKRGWWETQGDYQAQRERVGATEAAARWLAHRLRRTDGAAESAQLRADADDAGIPGITLRRARAQLQASRRLVVERAGLPRGRTQWRLTTREERDQMITDGPMITRSDKMGD